MHEAREHYTHKRFTEALLGFERVLRLHAGQPQALLGKARVLADCGEDFEALEILERLVAGTMPAAAAAAARPTAADEVQVDALGLMAVLLHKKGLRDLAEQYLRRLSMLDPEHISLGLLRHGPDG